MRVEVESDCSMRDELQGRRRWRLLGVDRDLGVLLQLKVAVDIGIAHDVGFRKEGSTRLITKPNEEMYIIVTCNRHIHLPATQ